MNPNFNLLLCRHSNLASFLLNVMTRKETFTLGSSLRFILSIRGQDKMRGEGVKKCLFLSMLRVYKTVHAGGGEIVKECQNSVHVVVE